MDSSNEFHSWTQQIFLVEIVDSSYILFFFFSQQEKAKIYKKTNDIHDVRYAVKKGCVQAQQDLVSAEKEIEREQKKQERNRKNESVHRYVITFLLMLIPSFIVSFYGILRIIDDIFGVDSFLVIFLVWFGVDVLATVIWRRIFD